MEGKNMTQGRRSAWTFRFSFSRRAGDLSPDPQAASRPPLHFSIVCSVTAGRFCWPLGPRAAVWQGFFFPW